MSDAAGERVFSSLHLTHAEVVRQILQTEGLHATVHNQMTVSLGGELPFDQCLAQVWVPDTEAQQAREVLQELQRAPDADVTTPCPGCQAPLSAELAVCWQCGALPEGIAEVVFEPAAASEEHWHSRFGRYLLYAIGVSLLVGAALLLVQRVLGPAH